MLKKARSNVLHRSVITQARVLLLALCAFVPVVAKATDFEKDIRPLLERRCVECHGEKKQKGGLRLDAKVFAFKGGDDGPALVPGNSEKSALMARIISDDEDEQMPPKGERLTAAGIANIKAWIDAGALWPETDADRAAKIDKRLQHWAVQPLKKDFGPEASIDHFVHAKLRGSELAIAPEADRRTLIRRLSFDLLGMPPTPEQVGQFINDQDPRAYEKLVDQFLASPRYGERWAQHWLDIAHYADTHGFERDQLRPNAWRYRDYVIASLNTDKPYDVFLREQIAGDVIAPDDPAAVTATGFLAAGPWDFVGHVETRNPMLNRAARAGDLDDMVTQVITATMGITINCARCHDHKLDPITQEEYFRMWAVFAGVRRADREISPAETKRIADRKERLGNELAGVRAEMARLSGAGLDLADMVGGGDGTGTGVKGRGIGPHNGVVVTKKLGYLSDIPVNQLQKISWLPEPVAAAGLVKWVFVADGKSAVSIAPGVEVKGLPATSGNAWDAIRNGPLNSQVTTKINGVDFATDGHSILGLHANAGVTFDLARIREASGKGVLRLTGVVGFGAGPEVAATRADFTVFVDERQCFQKVAMRKDEFALLDVPIPADAKTLTFVATEGGDGIGHDLLFLGDARLLTENDKIKLAENQAKLGSLRADAERVGAAIRALPEPAKVYAFTSDAKPPAVKLQRRGNPEDEGQAVKPGGLAWVKHAPPEFGDDSTPEGERRRALAAWITDAANPLTPRVLVNRLWHYHFGQGLVATPSDFGLAGDMPSHPELLDWLASEFLKSGWSRKHIHRLIVTSAAYRQQSAISNEKARSLDASNRLLWRQNPRRLDAESLHDAVLSVSGKFNSEMGGPGYRDFKYTEAYAPIYDYITPDSTELWRRSIYRLVVRTTPDPFMSTLDCPNSANFTPVRNVTTTALQSLALLNNDFMQKQSVYFSARAKSEAGEEIPRQVARAFEIAFERKPGVVELDAASALVKSRGLVQLCRMLLNANEFVYVD